MGTWVAHASEVECHAINAVADSCSMCHGLAAVQIVECFPRKANILLLSSTRRLGQKNTCRRVVPDRRTVAISNRQEM